MNSFNCNLPADLVSHLEDAARESGSGAKEMIFVAVRQALAYLTEKERSLVFARVEAGLKTELIMERFGFNGWTTFKRRWGFTLKALRLLTLYFASYDHSIALNQLHVLGAAGPILLDLFQGRSFATIRERRGVTNREITGAVQIYERNLDKLGEGSLRAFVETAVELSKLKRLDGKVIK